MMYEAIATLRSDVIMIALPSAFIRLVTGLETRASTRLVLGIVLAAFAHSLFSGGRGTWLSLLAVCTAQAASYCGIGLRVVPVIAAALCFAAPAWQQASAHYYHGSTQLPTSWAPQAGAVLLSSIAVAEVLWWLRRYIHSWRGALGVIVLAVLAPFAYREYASISTALVRAAAMVLPIGEFDHALQAIQLFISGAELEAQLATLALVTFNCQVGVGQLGVAYLRSAQSRKNRLLTVAGAAVPPAAPPPPSAPEAIRASTPSGNGDGPTRSRSPGRSPGRRKAANGRAPARSATVRTLAGPEIGSAEGGRSASAHGMSARGFTRTVCGFILWTAAPYFVQRSVFEEINHLAQIRAFDQIENALRLKVVLADSAAFGALSRSNHTVDSHVESLQSLLKTPFQLIERKLFSLPKLALLPAVFGSHPLLTVLGLPISLAVDALKSAAVAELTRQIETRRRTYKELKSKRTRVESFDTKHADHIASSGALPLTRAMWSEITLAVQATQTEQKALEGVRNWIRWLYWQDVLNPGIECAIAFLLEAGHIGLSEVRLYARVIVPPSVHVTALVHALRLVHRCGCTRA